MRAKYRYRDGRMVDETGLPMLTQYDRAQEPCAPMVISDTQPVLQSMVTGNYHDSKSNMRKEYKQHGVEEVGNDLAANRQRRDWIDERNKRKKQREQIKASLHKAHSRMGFGAV